MINTEAANVKLVQAAEARRSDPLLYELQALLSAPADELTRWRQRWAIWRTLTSIAISRHDWRLLGKQLQRLPGLLVRGAWLWVRL